jgi:PAS domain S-box-containing protein
MTVDALLDAIPLPAWVHDVETREVVAANDEFVTLIGHPREALIGMSVLDLCAPSDRERVTLLCDRLLALPEGQLQHPAPFRLLVQGGGSVRARVSSKPVPSVGRHARLAVAHDILRDDAEQARERLAQSEQRYRTLFDACPIAACVYDLATLRFTAVNEAMVRLYGYSRDEMLAMTVLELVAPEHQGFVGSIIEDLRKGLRPGVLKHGGTVLHRTRAGEDLEIMGTAASLTDGGHPARLVLHNDVTQRKRAEAELASAHEALRMSESLSRSILDNMLSALITLGEDGVIQSANPAAEKMFGCTSAELVGAPFTSLFETAAHDLEGLLATAFGRVTEWKGKPKGGERFPCELRLFRLESLRGTGFAAILHDVSERYEVERMKSEFVSVVSHELRTPLTALRGSIGLLAGGVLGALPENVMELLSIADRNTLRLISLVNDILDLERLQTGKMALFIRPVCARPILDRSLESVAQLAEQERIRLEVQAVDDLVLGDPERLIQVLVNLLSNAVKFSSPGDVVVITAAAEPACVVFRVTDHGRGVPLPYRRVIFERFHQVHASDSREKGGTGLGLAISKAIVEQHQGTIGVESEEGQGSTFWFRIPRPL